MITKEQDAFGAAAMAYFKGDKEARIQLDSDIPGAEPVLEKMSEYFQEYEDFNFEYKEALKYARGRVLDVGCGAGRFLLYLQQCGLEVVGIDESPLALEVCRLRGARDVRLMDAWDLDIAQLGEFDTILLFGHNLGIGRTPLGVKKLLASFSRLTKKGGRLLVNSIDVSVEPKSQEQVEYNRTIGRYIGQIRYRLTFKEYDRGWFDWIYVPPGDLKAWAEELGWRLTHIFCNPDKPGYWAGVL